MVSSNHQPPREYTDADFVDRVFAYLEAEFPELPALHLRDAREAVRRHFAGERAYIPRGRTPDEREQLAVQVLRLFNGRNASEVARRLGVGRTTVYKLLKQPGRKNRSRFSTNETAATLRSARAPAPTPARRKPHRDASQPKEPTAWPSPSPTSTPSTPPSPAVN